MGQDKLILDQDGNVITNPDMSIGYLVDECIIKKDAIPIDNITKFAWDDDDYEEIYRYIVIPKNERTENRVIELKELLLDTDYIVNKVIEGAASWDDYPGIREQRQQWRDEINELEKTINI